MYPPTPILCLLLLLLVSSSWVFLRNTSSTTKRTNRLIYFADGWMFPPPRQSQQRYDHRTLLETARTVYPSPLMMDSTDSTCRISTGMSIPNIPQPPSPTVATIRQNRYSNDRTVLVTDETENDGHHDDMTSLSITVPPYRNPDKTGTTYAYPSLLHNIHVTNVLSPAQVRHCLTLAQQHAQTTKCWDTPDHHRHASYATCDFPIDACVPLQQYLDDDTVQFDTRIFQILQTFFQIPNDQMYYIDLFCAQYQATASAETTATTTTSNSMDRLGLHRDGSLLSFTITLSEPNRDFTGGGTYFDALQNVTTIIDTDTFHTDRTMLQTATLDQVFHTTHEYGVVRPQTSGDGVFHCGKLLHGGYPITSGTRIVLVGFVDVVTDRETDYWKEKEDDDDDDEEVDSLVIRPGRIHAACRDWGRLDVATYRYQRQQEQKRRFSKRRVRSERSTNKWIPSHNCFRNIHPIVHLHSIQHKKAGWDMIYQRQRRLQIEDELLRSILLPNNKDNDDDNDDDDINHSNSNSKNSRNSERKNSRRSILDGMVTENESVNHDDITIL